MQITGQILESDYPAVERINYSSVQKIKKMLYILERANLLNLLSSEAASLKNMSKPDKIFCDNTNIMYSLTETINVGTKRETFFLNQLRSAGHTVTYPRQGDFMVDGRYLFEVGGKSKSFDQIKDIPDSYLAIDDEEIGRGNKIPLWMFGIMY